MAVYPTGIKLLECPRCHNGVNEYGIRVYVTKCKTCGVEFTVCPVPDNLDDWQHCMSEGCASYDQERDADKLFGGNHPCVCTEDDEYCCWAERYNMWSVSTEEIEADGGPCSCSCHDWGCEE